VCPPLAIPEPCALEATGARLDALPDKPSVLSDPAGHNGNAGSRKAPREASDAALQQTLPYRSRREKWQRIQDTMKLTLPDLRHDATVGDLARDVMALNHARLVAEIGSWNKSDVGEALCRVIVMRTSVQRDRITPEALIIDDLGID